MPDAPPPTRRDFVSTRAGLVHAARCGAGFPVLFLHQTPRSWDEYRDVLPLVGRRASAIAMDTPGFGDSPPLAGIVPSIEAWARTAIALLDALEVDRACIAGHHTGAVVAMELAAAAPARVAALVLSSCPMVDAARREHHGRRTALDTIVPDPDGAHLVQLWCGRKAFYPAGDTALLGRFVVDALRAGPMAAEGHRVVNRYRMEDRVGLVRAPTLIIAATNDPHAYPATPSIARAVPGAEVVEIEGGTVPLPDAMPAEFSRAVLDFMERQKLLHASS